jgi:Protein of unknown function (DUF1329)
MDRIANVRQENCWSITTAALGCLLRGISSQLISAIAALPIAMLAIGVSGVLAYGQDQPLPPAGDGIPDQLAHYTLKNYTDWVKQYQDVKPEFKPGDTLTQKDIAKLRPFIPPGFYEMLNFSALRMEIAPPENMSPDQAYMNCTEKYSSQTKLDSEGALVNYVCGQPFPLSQIRADDPTSGLKEAWNYNWRPRTWGVRNLNAWVLVRPGGTHSPWDHTQPPGNWFVSPADQTGYAPPEIGHYYGGGGNVERIIEGIFQLFQYSHVAEFMDTPSKGFLTASGAQNIEFKEWDAFYSPFDIRGTAFVQIRYLDPRRADDSWAYIPVLRRVRRISTEVKSDSLLGTDFTLDDFWGFNARVLDWKWTFLGFKDMLGTIGIKNDFEHFYGPMGTIPDDWYRLRKTAVIVREPKYRHTYSAAIMFVDTETSYCLYHFPFDKAGHLWKTNIWQYRFSEDTERYTRDNKGVRALDFNGVVATDVQNKHATIIPGYAGGHPRLTPSDTERLFDINSLDHLHR